MKGRLTPRGAVASVPHSEVNARLQPVRAELRSNEWQADAPRCGRERAVSVRWAHDSP